MSDGEGTLVKNQILNPAHQTKQLEVEEHVQLIERKSQMLDEVSFVYVLWQKKIAYFSKKAHFNKR